MRYKRGVLPLTSSVRTCLGRARTSTVVKVRATYMGKWQCLRVNKLGNNILKTF